MNGDATAWPYTLSCHVQTKIKKDEHPNAGEFLLALYNKIGELWGENCTQSNESNHLQGFSFYTRIVHLIELLASITYIVVVVAVLFELPLSIELTGSTSHNPNVDRLLTASRLQLSLEWRRHVPMDKSHCSLFTLRSSGHTQPFPLFFE